MKILSRLSSIGLLFGLMTTWATQVSAAPTAAEIDASVNAALGRLHTDVKGSDEVTSKAKGVLVFPEVVKAGFVVGGEGGTGSLLIGGKPVDYYTIGAASIGLQAGAQKRDIVIAFMDDVSLTKFQTSDGWKVGADGSVTLIDVGATGQVDFKSINKPIVGFVVGEKGLMAGISLDGSKITKVAR
jgi:lipid-binding SYLF domain-containing protein